MNGALLWIAGLIVTLLAALFAVPYAVDWNSYRGVFEEQASRMLGREVRVGGDVKLSLLPVPYVRFEKPRIAGAEFGDALFRADSFTMWLDLPPLVQGILEAKQIELERPVLRLQIEEDGGGDWRTFRVKEAALPFVPREVALKSVRITDGVLAVHDVAGKPLTRIEIAEGKLSSPALEGPYRVRADVRWNGDVREVRVSTAPPDPDGSTRLKVAVRTPSSGNSYTFDGRVVDLFGRPQIDGQLTAVIPVSSDPDRLRPTTAAGNEQPSPAPAVLHKGAFEVRAAVSADAVSAKLSDIAFSFEQNGQPQLLTGTAEASWRDRPVARANLTSRWLDLDRIADVEPDANALEAVRRLTSSVVGFLPTQAEVAARLSIDQANLAGELVSNLAVSLENTGAGLTIERFHAALPGGTRIDLSGSLSGSDTAEAFDGEILLRGANLSRFLGWAARGSPFADARSGASFSLGGDLKLGSGRLELTKASVDTGPNRLTGDVSYRWDGRRKLVLNLETGHADISGVLPGALGPDLLKANLGALAGAGPDSGLAELVAGLAGADIGLRLRADALTDGVRMLHNVDADFTIENGSLSIPGLRASTPEGFKLEIDGTVQDFADQAVGSLHGVVEARTPGALTEALNIGIGDIDADKQQWLASLAPLRLAFVTSFGRHGDAGAEIRIDGTAHGRPLVATMLLDGGVTGWRNAPVDVLLTSDNPDVARIARGLLLGGADERDSSETPTGRFVLKAIGTPAESAALHVRIVEDDLQLVLKGHGALRADAPMPTFDGELEVTSASTARAFRLAGLPLPARAAQGGLSGKIGVIAGEAGLTLALSQLEIGDTRLTGKLELSGAEGENARRADLDLEAGSLSLPVLLALALDGSIDDLLVSDLADLTDWQDKPFDLGNLEHINGHVKLQAETLILGQGFGLANATLEAELEPGRITITKLEGQALGGAVSGAFKLEKTAAGAEMSGALGLWDLRLDRINGASDAPVGAGQLQLSLELKGQAVSPRALIPVLTGKGELQLKSARWERLSPKAIETAADAVLSGKTEPTGEPVRQILRTALANEPLKLGEVQVPVEIGAGALKIATFSVDRPAAQVTNQTTIDLTELKIDSEWKLQPKATRGNTTPLPGISVVYVGPLRSLGSLEPQLVMDMLERELAVRGMERNVERLEQLRREDEARAEAEAERLKTLELEHLRQLEDLQGAGAQGPTIDVPFPFPVTPPTGAPLPQHLIIEPEAAPPARTVAPRPATPRRSEAQWPQPDRPGL